MVKEDEILTNEELAEIRSIVEFALNEGYGVYYHNNNVVVEIVKKLFNADQHLEVLEKIVG